ncbi:MAG: hypothetical protein COB26_04750 [Piscirickettsiaceae bacterium]|nr:MAG: hypothetical protein COB89_00490 [Piscirickettsiaceae bacterium]PCI70296.1 MAG: hypothetical protein COB26_04750 [Piscirickettsiaceae bacterium]
MIKTVADIINEIRYLEVELEKLISEQQKDLLYVLKGAKIEFEAAALAKQKAIKLSLIQWLKTSKIQSIISAPFIYSMIVPIAFMHLSIEIYQAICFPLYNISKVKRSDYFIADRQQLAYLNIIEKFNCAYCSYGNAVVAYTREIIGRTEFYWCPIKHAKKVLGTHKHYQQFLDFGEFENYHEKIETLRSTMSKLD